MARQIIVISAGLSQPSSTRLLADQIAEAVRAQVGARGEEAQIEVIELRELAIELATTMITGGIPTPRLSEVKNKISAADGLIAVTPVFSASYSGLFKMLFDVLDTDALNGMPVIIAATAGTARHSLVLDHALRPLFSYLRAVIMPTGVFAATEDFGGGAAGTDLARRIQRAASEFTAQVVAEKTGVGGFVPNLADQRTRKSGVALDNKITPFAQLLQGHTGIKEKI
ncbi:FMN reductase [Paenochrobactrum gallinarii]|uniref:FMN reductase n=1 Tax=Paenochrobactrum gallinarii TaxID=643673 RepID=A0A841LTF9_9HYPH|nr:FMN reductase [Paenochrobactrum gallinarii]MBB6261393.1 FMN reductase [Paenochrobactrum gallinarii]